MRKKKLDTHISPRLSEISQARCRGATKKEIAELLGISLATLNRAQRENEDLAFALRPVPAQEMEREKIKEAFLKRACGYIAREEVREMRENKLPDGRVERELVLTKLVSKEVPPLNGCWKTSRSARIMLSLMKSIWMRRWKCSGCAKGS